MVSPGIQYLHHESQALDLARKLGGLQLCANNVIAVSLISKFLLSDFICSPYSLATISQKHVNFSLVV